MAAGRVGQTAGQTVGHILEVVDQILKGADLKGVDHNQMWEELGYEEDWGPGEEMEY